MITDDMHPWWLDHLANRDPSSVRALVKHHSRIPPLLHPGERLCGIGIDVRGNAGINVVTGDRVIQFKRNRILNEASRDRIHGTHLLVRPNGGYLVVVEGPGLFAPGFADHADANRFATVIDRYLVGRPHPPRDIPPLFPDFHRTILVSTGKPDDPNNVARLALHIARGITQAGAMRFFGDAGDEDARLRFLTRFDVERAHAERLMTMGDEMIDWLWDWHPACHGALRGLVAHLHRTLTHPESFLRTCGDVIPT